MQLTWLGHSAFRLELGSNIILIDPFLKGNPSFSGDFKKVTQGVTHILISHGHDDHIGDAAEIAKRSKAMVVANYEICMWLQAQGAKNINPANTGGTVAAGDFTVTLTQAHHSSGTVVDDATVYLGNPNGLIINHASAPPLYHMGDTDVFGDMGLIAELYQPKIGLVPIGDRFTMGARTAAFAVKRFFDFSTVIPMHYGSFELLDTNATAFVGHMAGHKTEVVVPKVGQSLAF
jgi:L-ascorbate metabolism protein UlaG (beta-lactamase superfamily)